MPSESYYDSDVALEEPGTMTSVTTSNSNDRVASKVRASFNHRPMAVTTSAAAVMLVSDSDGAIEEPSRPGTMTSVANNNNNSSNDRVANKIRASYSHRPVAALSVAAATFSSDSDVAPEEPSRPGTVTSVARGGNDRISNKLRANMNHRPMATASTDATMSYDSDVAAEEPLRPGTVTSVANNSKIRATLASRPIASSMPYGSDLTLEEPPAHPGGGAPSTTTDRFANNGRTSYMASRAAASIQYDADVAPEEPPRPGTVTSVANNRNDRIARKIRSSVASRPAMAAYSSDSELEVEEPVGGTFTNMARAQNDRVANKIRASAAAKRSSMSSTSSHANDDDLAEPPVVAGTVTAIARTSSDRVANKIRRAGSQRRSAGYRETSDEAKSEVEPTKVGAVATRGDDPARAKNRWIQDDLFRDEEETGQVDVDPEEYFNQRTREMAAQRETEMLNSRRRDEEEKAGLLRDKVAKTQPRMFPGDGLLKTLDAPSAHKSRSIRKVKALDPTKGSSFVRRDDTIRSSRQEYYEEPSFWDQMDKPTIAVGCIILVTVLVALITPIVLIRQKGDLPGPSSSSLRMPLYDRFQEALQSVSDPKALANHSTPQFKALNFIVYGDLTPLSVDSPNLVQRYVLMVLFYSTGGPIWRSQTIPWGSGIDECSWDYVECENVELQNATKRYMRFSRQWQTGQRSLLQRANSTVVGLHLYRAGLIGTLPDEIRELSHLVTLDLADNRLERNTIPSVLYNLTLLHQISIENNQFSGTVSTAISALSQLKYLSFFNNLLTGSLPSTMGLLSNLETFYAFGNSPLKGPFFRYALRWPRIKRIDIANNAFTGSIPSEIDRLSRLEVLNLAHNRFEGTLPTTLGNLPLESLTTSQNLRLIEGTIPTEFGQLKFLTHLILDTGALTGTVPAELGNLRSLVQLNLSQNRLQGSLPSQLGSCISLTDLELENNELNGTIPSELGRISGLQVLRLENNNLDGSVPQQICLLRNRTLIMFATDCASSVGVQCQQPDCCTDCRV